MSNSWSYPFLFDDAHPVNEEMLTRILGFLSSLGYSIWLSGPEGDDGSEPNDQKIVGPGPSTRNEPKKVEILGLDGMTTWQFSDSAEIIRFMAEKGGLVTLWKNQGQMAIYLTSVPEEHEINLGVGYAFRTDDEDRVATAKDLKRAFHEICLQLNPFYGYSVDEYGLEAVFSKNFQKGYDDFCLAVHQMEHPPVIFWMNYFRMDYLKQLGRLDFWKTDIVSENAKEGVFVYLADQPWNEVLACRHAEGFYSRYRVVKNTP